MAKKKAKKKPQKATNSAVHRAPAKLDALDKKTLALIESTADAVQKKIFRRILPELKFPVRSLSNVRYDRRVGYFELGKGRKSRALSVNTVKNFAQTLRLMSISKEMVESITKLGLVHLQIENNNLQKTLSSPKFIGYGFSSEGYFLDWTVFLKFSICSSILIGVSSEGFPKIVDNASLTSIAIFLYSLTLFRFL